MSKRDFRDYDETLVVRLGFSTFQMYTLDHKEKKEEIFPQTLQFENINIKAMDPSALNTDYDGKTAYYPLFYLNHSVPSGAEKFLNFEIKNPDKDKPTVNIKLNNYYSVDMSAEVILALIFQSALKKIGVSENNSEAKKACLCSVPISLNGEQKATIKAVFQALGYKDVTFVSDVEVACFETDAFKKSKGRRVLIVNFGIVLTVAYADVSTNGIRIRQYREIDINKLNGRRIDELIADKYINKCNLEVNYEELLSECEQAKKELSNGREASIYDNGINQKQFDEILSDFADDFEREINQFKSDHKLGDEIETVVIGGTMNIGTLTDKIEYSGLNDNPSTIIIKNILKKTNIVNQYWDFDKDFEENLEKKENLIRDELTKIKTIMERPEPVNDVPEFKKVPVERKSLEWLYSIITEYFKILSTKILMGELDPNVLKDELFPEQFEAIKNTRGVFYYDKDIEPISNDITRYFIEIQNNCSCLEVPYNLNRIEYYTNQNLGNFIYYEEILDSTDNRNAGYSTDNRNAGYSTDNRNAMKPMGAKRSAFLSMSDNIFAFITNPTNSDFNDIPITFGGGNEYTIIVASKTEFKDICVKSNDFFNKLLVSYDGSEYYSIKLFINNDYYNEFTVKK